MVFLSTFQEQNDGLPPKFRAIVLVSLNTVKLCCNIFLKSRCNLGASNVANLDKENHDNLRCSYSSFKKIRWSALVFCKCFYLVLVVPYNPCSISFNCESFIFTVKKSARKFRSLTFKKDKFFFH